MRKADCLPSSSSSSFRLPQWAADRDFLETTQSRLLAELDLAREAETYLEQQKIENLSLKETINRLRADLDELRLSAAAASGGGAGGGKGRSRGPSTVEEGTMGRSLEKELLRELRAAGQETAAEGSEMDEEEDEGSVKEDEDDGYIETFITTSRRRVRLASLPLHARSNHDD